MIIIISIAVVVYLMLTGIAIFLAADSCSLQRQKNSVLMRKILGILLVGWIVTIFWMLFHIGMWILMLFDKIFGFDF